MVASCDGRTRKRVVAFLELRKIRSELEVGMAISILIFVSPSLETHWRRETDDHLLLCTLVARFDHPLVA